MTNDELPPFPVDDVTLGLVEHAMAGALTYDRPDDADPDDHGPWFVGADMSLSGLLDFLAGTMGDDPNEQVLNPGRDESDLPPWERDNFANARVVYDTRPHYSERDLIRALIAEVRRLRALTAEPGAPT